MLPNEGRPVWRALTPPAGEPITLEQAKSALRVDHDEDDAWLQSLITAARQRIEHEANRLFLRQSVESLRDGFYCGARVSAGTLLLLPGIVSTVAALEVLQDGSYVAVDPALYDVDTARVPARVVPVSPYSWPSHDRRPNAVRLTFDAGYATTAAIPEQWLRPLYFLVSHWYKNPDAYQQDGRTPAEIPLGYRYLVDAMNNGAAR
jgi:uncharacterized phiE125 gp8 family phage protein